VGHKTLTQSINCVLHICCVHVEGERSKRKGGKAAKNKPGPLCVDHNHLACNYYRTIVAGFSLIKDLPQAIG